MDRPEMPGNRPGWPPPERGGSSGAPEPSPPRTNDLAFVALVIAVANVVFGSFLGLFVPLVPLLVTVLVVVLGHVSLAQIRRRGQDGRTVALTALVIGYLGLAGAVVLLVLAFSYAAVGMAVLGF